MNTHPITGSHEYESAQLRMIELALRNPRAGTPEAAELVTLSERTRVYESARYLTHPVSGDVQLK